MLQTTENKTLPLSLHFASFLKELILHSKRTVLTRTTAHFFYAKTARSDKLNDDFIQSRRKSRYAL
jgi:hypothetical protein